MILTGLEIKKQRKLNNINIHPYNEAHLGANSYDVTLHERLLVYEVPSIGYLDMKKVNPTIPIDIPPEGIILKPGKLYLGSTVESATSQKFVPLLEGRSSIGRLGIKTHITAGFGDIGWGYEITKEHVLCTGARWTLEIEVAHPIRVYAGVRIAQVYFITPKGKITYYRGKYSRQTDATASRLHEDFKEKTNG